MAYRACTVSFVDRGMLRQAKVDAETMYEAAALALKAFGQKPRVHGPSRNTVLEVAVDTPPSMKVKVGAVLDWLYYTPAKSEVEKERKARLRALLLEERR
jgi:hypothetical protein